MKKALATLTAVIIVITSIFSVSIISTSAAVLKAPAVTKFETVANGVRLTWAKVPGAARYRVFVKNGNRWKTLGDTYGTTWTDKKAAYGKNYTYTVRCVTRNGRSFTSYYNRNGFTTKRLSTPRVTAIAGVKNGTKITWNKIAGADKYRVFVKANGKWKAVANTTNTSYVNTNVANGKSYTYTVRCLSKNGKVFTSYFNTSGYTVRYDATPALSDVSSTEDGLKLTWQKGNNALYRVFTKTESGWKTIAETASNEYTDTNVTDGTAYTYTVRCVAPNRKYYTSDYDKIGVDTTYTVPQKAEEPTEPIQIIEPSEPVTPINPTEQEKKFIPTISKTELDGGKIKFSWNKIDGIYTYAVYYKDGNSFTLLSDEVQIDSYPYTFNKAGDYTFAVIACDPSDDKPHVAPEKAQFTVTIKYVVDQEAYSYQKPITEQVAYACCNKCGADVTGDENGRVGEYDPEHSDMYMILYHNLYENCNGGWHTDYKNITTGYETVNVPEKGHFEIA